MIFGEDGFWWYETRHLQKQLDQMRIDNHKLRADNERMREALKVAREAISGCHTNVFGQGHSGHTHWYIRNELVSKMDDALEDGER